MEKRKNFLSVPQGVWNSVGAIAAVLALFLAWSTTNTRALRLYCSASQPLFDASARSQSGVVITHDGKPLNNPHTLSASLVCSGNTPIRAEDIESPVTLNLNIKPIDVRPRSNESIGPLASLAIDQNDIVIKHGLLNPGDRIEFDVLADGPIALNDVTGRVAGVKSIVIIPNGETDTRRIEPFWIRLHPTLKWTSCGLVSATIFVLIYKAMQTALSGFRRRIELHRLNPAVVFAVDSVLGLSSITTNAYSATLFDLIRTHQLEQFLRNRDTISGLHSALAAKNVDVSSLLPVPVEDVFTELCGNIRSAVCDIATALRQRHGQSISSTLNAANDQRLVVTPLEYIASVRDGLARDLSVAKKQFVGNIAGQIFAALILAALLSPFALLCVTMWRLALLY